MISCIILFNGDSDLRLLDNLGVNDPYVLKNFPYITLCHLTEEQILLLKKEENVVSVELDGVDEFEVESFSTQDESYAIDLLEVKKYHSKGYKGEGINIAVFDSGTQRHEDLVIKGGINAFDRSVPYDKNLHNSHGTMVAGVIGMQDNNIGGLGVAPECNLYVVKLDDNKGSNSGGRWSEQIIGLNWSLENNIDIINCSFSGFVDSRARYEAFKDAHSKGLIICGSAGNKQHLVNDLRETMGFPCSYPFVIAVANIHQDKKRRNSSCVGAHVDFSSGGTNIYSTTTDKNNSVSKSYRSGTGTSYASPSIAGVIALHMQMFPSYSRDKILSIMHDNAERIGDSWEYGSGIPKFPEKEYHDVIMKCSGVEDSDVQIRSKVEEGELQIRGSLNG